MRHASTGRRIDIRNMSVKSAHWPSTSPAGMNSVPKRFCAAEYNAIAMESSSSSCSIDHSEKDRMTSLLAQIKRVRHDLLFQPEGSTQMRRTNARAVVLLSTGFFECTPSKKLSSHGAHVATLRFSAIEHDDGWLFVVACNCCLRRASSFPLLGCVP